MLLHSVHIAYGYVHQNLYEYTVINTLSTLPEVIENITTKKAMINSIVIGITEVLITY